MANKIFVQILLLFFLFESISARRYLLDNIKKRNVDGDGNENAGGEQAMSNNNNKKSAKHSIDDSRKAKFLGTSFEPGQRGVVPSFVSLLQPIRNQANWPSNLFNEKQRMQFQREPPTPQQPQVYYPAQPAQQEFPVANRRLTVNNGAGPLAFNQNQQPQQQQQPQLQLQPQSKQQAYSPQPQQVPPMHTVLTCEGHRYAIPYEAPFYSCCGHRVYYWPNETCALTHEEEAIPESIASTVTCGGTAFPVPSASRFHYACCGEILFDTRVSQCSFGALIPNHNQQQQPMMQVPPSQPPSTSSRNDPDLDHLARLLVEMNRKQKPQQQQPQQAVPVMQPATVLTQPQTVQSMVPINACEPGYICKSHA